MTVYQPGYVQVSVDLSSSTWNTVASHEVFTVTGLVRMKMVIECAETLTDAADAATIQFGYAGATNSFIAATGAAGNGGSTISAGELWYDTSPTTQVDTYANAQLDYIVNELDVGYEIAGAAITDGTLVFHCWWERIDPTETTASVVAGAGGTL